MKPRVSCLMPVYNTSAYLADAIESILDQKYDAFEFVIANDGSTDGSDAIIARYAAQDSRIVHLSRKENRGLVYTRNELIAHAHGEWFATMDSDDIALPERFERQVAFIDANPGYDVVGSAALLIDPEGNPMCEMGVELSHEEIDAWHMAGSTGTAFVSPTAMIRASALRAVDGYREHNGCAEDYDVLLRLAEKGQLCTIPDVLLRYRQHFGSLGYDSNREQRNGIRWAVEDAYRRRGISIPDDLFDEPIPNRTESYSYRQWSEWSLRGGNVDSARHYGWKAIALAPWSPRGWRALVRAWAADNAA